MTTTTTDAPAQVRYRTLAGNLTRDPELRFSAKGTAWATCGLAVNRRKRLDDGTWEEGETEFYDLVSFGDLAEHLAELSKGTRVLACGRIEEDTWTGKDGAERTTTRLVCDEVGVSLRFASVTVERAERRGPARGSAADGGYDEEPF